MYLLKKLERTIERLNDQPLLIEKEGIFELKIYPFDTSTDNSVEFPHVLTLSSDVGRNQKDTNDTVFLGVQIAAKTSLLKARHNN